MSRAFLVTAFVCCIIGHGNAAQLSQFSETTKTANAVIAVEHHWTQAEIHGDVAYVSQLLSPQYQSVNADGTAHSRGAIVASTKKNGQSDKMARLVARYAKLYPSGTIVKIQGDAAVVTFYSLKRGPQKGVTSSDIFAYVDGRWHAIYSQHTQVL